MKKNSSSIATRVGGKALFLSAFLSASALMAASPLPVDLGTAGNFTLLAKTGISATGTTSIVGNIGVAPAAATYITGFGLSADASNQFSTSSLVNGRVYAADYSPPTPAIMTTAIGDMEAAYTDAAGRAPNATELYAGNLSGKTFAAGVYKWSSGVLIAGDMTLSGSADEVWIFQIAQTLDLSNGIHVNLIGGAQSKNIFWQVAGQTTLGTTSVMQGNVLDQVAIVMNTGAVLSGKALAQSAVTLDATYASSASTGYAGHNPPQKNQSFAFPSPARNGVVTFVYDMTESGKAVIRVWNEIGDLVVALEEQKLKGPQKTRLSVKDFAPGLYLFKVGMTYDSGQKENLPLEKFTVAKQ